MNSLIHSGQLPLHIDTLRVRYGYYILVNPMEVRRLGGGRRRREAELLEEERDMIWSRLGRGL